MSTALPDDTLRALLDAHAPFRAPPACPELPCWHADDELALWQGIEAKLGGRVGAPFFCVAWPGAQLVARLLLDGEHARGAHVVDVGCGGGLCSLAAFAGGAARVIALDIDPLAVQTTRLLVARSRPKPSAELRTVVGDALATSTLIAEVDRALQSGGRSLVLFADLVYDRDIARALGRVLRSLASRDVDIILADSGRPFFADAVAGLDLAEIATATIAVPSSIDGVRERRTRAFMFRRAEC